MNDMSDDVMMVRMSRMDVCLMKERMPRRKRGRRHEHIEHTAGYVVLLLHVMCCVPCAPALRPMRSCVARRASSCAALCPPRTTPPHLTSPSSPHYFSCLKELVVFGYVISFIKSPLASLLISTNTNSAILYRRDLERHQRGRR